MSPNISHLKSRALVAVTGPDRAAFLQGLLTQDMETLQSGELRFAALLTPQGRLMFDLFVFADGDALVLDVAAGRRDALVQRLMIYRLRSKVQVAARDGEVLAVWGEGAVDGALPDPRLPDLGARFYGGDVAGTLDEAAYHTHRLALGVPDPAKDAAPETAYPIELDFDLLHGIDFHKGCYVGQETTSRMKRRGVIKTRALPLAFDGPALPFGAEVLAGELRAGEVLSGQDGRAMALLRLDRIEAGGLTVEGRPVRVERPDWFTAAQAG